MAVAGLRCFGGQSRGLSPARSEGGTWILIYELSTLGSYTSATEHNKGEVATRHPALTDEPMISLESSVSQLPKSRSL